jgi:hypothetical protein
LSRFLPRLVLTVDNARPGILATAALVFCRDAVDVWERRATPLFCLGMVVSGGSVRPCISSLNLCERLGFLWQCASITERIFAVINVNDINLAPIKKKKFGQPRRLLVL